MARCCRLLDVMLLAGLLLAGCGVESLESVELVAPTTRPYTATPVPPTPTATPVPVIPVGMARPPVQRPPISSSNAGQLLVLRQLAGHRDAWVFGVAFSPDGSVLASGGHDHMIRVWEVETGAELMAFAGHSGRVFAVAISPDGSVLASAANDGTVRLWELPADGVYRNIELGVLGTPGNVTIAAVAFSPNGQQLITGGRDFQAEHERVLTRWAQEKPPTATLAAALRTGASAFEEASQLVGHTAAILSIAFRPDGQQFATGSYDNTINLWAADGETPQQTITGHEDWVAALDYSLDGELLASGAHDGSIILWDVAAGTAARTLHADSPVWDVAFNPAGSLLASANADGTVWLWQVATGERVAVLERHTDTVRSVAFNPDGSLLASAGDDGTIQLWAVTR